MSSVAAFHHIEVSKLAQLKEMAQIQPTIEKKLFSKKFIDPYSDFFYDNALEFADYNWSGYAITFLVEFLLDKKEVDLGNGAYHDLAKFLSDSRECLILIFSKADKDKFLPHLDRSKYTAEELMEFNAEFADIPDIEFANAQLDGIDALRYSLETLNDDNLVVIITVG
jgi:hypothetical protein